MYYGGIDLGTSSVGWAVTDEKYNLIRKKGKDLWGVRLFDKANSAQERRTNRVSRRRRAREVARIGMIKEYFSDEIEKVDAGFYQRLEESKYHFEDKKVKQRFALFADAGFTDKEYYKKYPTIFHLRKELLESTDKHDVRLIYLAVLNLFKRRGHFLSAGLDDNEKEESIAELYAAFINLIAEKSELIFPEKTDFEKMEDILGSKEFSRSECAEKLSELLGISKNKNKVEYEIVKMICGLSGRLISVFGKEVLGEEYSKKQLSFRDGSCEEIMNSLADVLTDSDIEMLEAVKAIHDKGLLSNILKGHTYLSQARVASYEKHAQDLRRLRTVIKKYCVEEYDNYFRVMADNNYSGYIGSVNSGKEKQRRNHNATKENYKAFWSETKRLLNKMPQEDKDVLYLKKELEKDTLLPKQLNFANGVIPNQVHLSELKKILYNAENYLDFLKERDESGLTVSERIVRLYQFQIPYYVGPLHVNAGEEDKKWVQRKESGKVLPWNLEEKVDLAETRQRFITKMVRQCSYMDGKYVLPKNSLLYERFMVLNELNTVKVNGVKLPVELKQSIYRDLFLGGKKVTVKALLRYLCANGILHEKEVEAVTGIDGDFKHTLVSYARFYSVIGEKITLSQYCKMAEQIIFWGTVYSNDKKLMKELISKAYGSESSGKLLSEEQIKRILGFKWKDWGRLSKEFLELQGCAKSDGVVISLIRAMWETDCNLMELLSDNFTFIDALRTEQDKKEKLLSEFTYDDLRDSYLSASVKRMTWQTLLILKELCQVMKESPKKLFIEMPRGEGEKGKRSVSRKKKFEELYKNCRDESRNWISEIDNFTEDEFRSKKLYLYYTQKGRCMYTGNAISLNELLQNNSKYDIDHIYPRHYVKDDSIENNLVLVEKESNGHKSDNFPIEQDIRRKNQDYWRSLRDGGFISEEKYKRLIRNWEFSEEELAGFINRQIVETGQATKYVAHLLEELLPETEIVYVKAGNVSEFRHKTDLLKSRTINDFHHAQDAYLSIVVGNTYQTKFTSNPLNFIKEYERNRSANRYHMDKIFQFDVARNGVTAWVAGNHGTIVTVRKMIDKNTPLITKRTYEAHGGIANQTIYSAKEANVQSYIPVKGHDERLSNVTKYGGFSSVSGTYYFLVEHEKKGKRVRTLEQMPLYLKDILSKDEEALKRYCERKLNLIQPDIRMSKIPMRALIKRNGYFLRIAGRTEQRILTENAVSLCLERQWINYIKKLESFKEVGKEEDGCINSHRKVSQERNRELYLLLLSKHNGSIFCRKPNCLGEKLKEKQELFEKLTIKDQVTVLLEILKATQCLNLSVSSKEMDLKMSPNKISNDVSGQDEFLLINQSVTGIYISTIDLKTV